MWGPPEATELACAGAKGCNPEPSTAASRRRPLHSCSFAQAPPSLRKPSACPRLLDPPSGLRSNCNSSLRSSLSDLAPFAQASLHLAARKRAQQTRAAATSPFRHRRGIWTELFAGNSVRLSAVPSCAAQWATPCLWVLVTGVY